MPGKLEAALHWASRGFRVFPLEANGKEPAFSDDWRELATGDPDALRRMWTDPVLNTERDFNIGVDCTGRVVVDVDVKNGQDGISEYHALGGDYETLVVATPSGGYHCYFDGPDSANAKLAPSIDVRSHHGYVIAPGSEIDGRPYQIVVDKPVAHVPEAIRRHLKAPYKRAEPQAGSVVDTDAAVMAAVAYLKSAPPAVEGQRGDETTYITAARLVRELALSEVTAYHLLMEHWNPRCVPPWEPDDMWAKVENAANYASAHVGRVDPATVFNGISIEPPPSLFTQASAGFGNARFATEMPPRPWMIDRLMMLHETTLIVAPGSAGKSSVSLAIIAHLAMGVPFGDFTVRCACKSILYNGEDSLDEMSRRLLAVCVAYELDYQKVRENVMLISGDDVDLRLVSAQGRNAFINEAVRSQLVEIASDPDVGCICYDPLVDVHEVDEGDNPHMNFVMRTIKGIAHEANVASLVMHHTTKSGNTRQEERVGNMDIARGASGIVFKSRIAFTLMNATTEDCEEYGLQDGERARYVRMDDAKMNLALAGEHGAMWFHKQGIRLANGDVVGVLKADKLTRNHNTIKIRVAELIIETLQANGQASMPIGQAVAVVKAREPLWSNRTDVDVRRRIEGLFATPYQVREVTIHARRDGEGAKSQLLIVMS